MTDLRDKLASMGQLHSRLAQSESRAKVVEREKNEALLQLNKLKEEIQELRSVVSAAKYLVCCGGSHLFLSSKASQGASDGCTRI